MKLKSNTANGCIVKISSKSSSICVEVTLILKTSSSQFLPGLSWFLARWQTSKTGYLLTEWNVATAVVSSKKCSISNNSRFREWQRKSAPKTLNRRKTKKIKMKWSTHWIRQFQWKTATKYMNKAQSRVLTSQISAPIRASQMLSVISATLHRHLSFTEKGRLINSCSQ